MSTTPTTTRFEYIHVWGPPRSGKTLNLQTMKRYYGCDIVIDDFNAIENITELHLRLAPFQKGALEPQYPSGCKVLLLSTGFGLHRKLCNALEKLDLRSIPVALAKQQLGSDWIEPSTV